MKPKLRVVVLCFSLLFCAALLAGCGGSALPDGMNAADVETAAKTVLDAANARDYETLVDLYTDGESIGHTPPTAEGWAASLDLIFDALGDFEGYGDVSFATVEDDDFGTYAVAVVEAKYQNQTVLWRVSFKPDMEVIGLRL